MKTDELLERSMQTGDYRKVYETKTVPGRGCCVRT